VEVSDYLDAIKERLIEDVAVIEFHIRRERTTLTDGYIRAKLRLRDGSMLEFSEYVQLSSKRDIEVITYSYHWAGKKGTLIKRWDNTPHHRELAGFPHHIHEGGGAVLPGVPVNIFDVLDEIAKSLKAL